MNEQRTNPRRRRRHVPGRVEVTTVDSLEAGDWISGHAQGLQLTEERIGAKLPKWNVLDSVRRLPNGRVELRISTSTYDVYIDNCLPELLVKRRMEAPR